MMRILSGSILAMLMFASGAALAAGSNADALPKPASALGVPVAPSSAASDLFSKSVFLRGTLGDVQIQVNVRPKAGIDEGVEGEYFVFGRPGKILLAGELEGDAVFLEESVNGTDVSGQWDGKREGDTIHGTWLSADGSVSKPFMLKVVQAEVTQSKTEPVRLKPLKP